MISEDKCGEISGIPKCCRRWYIKSWSTMSLIARKLYLRKIMLIPYIPCPVCKATKKFIKLNYCTTPCNDPRCNLF